MTVGKTKAAAAQKTASKAPKPRADGASTRPAPLRRVRGRPKGSLQQLSDAFLAALAADFEQGGLEALEALRISNPSVYLRVCASLIPKEVKVETSQVTELNDDELDRLIHALRQETGPPAGAGGREGEAPGREPAGGLPAVH